ncbi:MAG TPA: Ig-like domain-containing protein, partial [Anaerolineales bacterium]
MPVRNSEIRTRKSLLLLLLVLSLACSLPVIGQPNLPALAPTATLLPRPAGTPPPLPPTLVESDPPHGAELPIDKPVTLYFNQAMDRASVQSAASIAVSGQPAAAGSFTWINDNTLTFTPQQPFKPGSDLTLSVSTRAQSVRGLALSQPISLTYQTAGYLRLAQSLPAAGSKEVDPSSAVVAAFNRPVVPLGASGSLPPGFSISSDGQPVTQGSGSWLNTSTDIFYPQPALEGGKTYTVRISPDLRAVGGSPLDPNPSPDRPYEWSFSTALPRLVSMEPAQGSQNVRLDSKIVLNFNQPMDPASVQANFRLVGPGAAQVDGKIAWDEANTTLTFTPSSLLERNTAYNVILLGQALTRGGTPLGSPLNAILKTVPPLGVISTEPAQDGMLNPYASVVLHLTAPLPDKTILQSVTITPTVANLNPYWDDQDLSLHLNGDFAPSTAYTLTLASSLADAWGGPLGQPFSLSFHTAPLEPGLVVAGGSDVLFVTPQEASLPVQATNLSNVPLTIGSVPLADFFALLGPKGYDLKQAYQPAGQQSLDQTLGQVLDRSQPVDLALSTGQRPLVPGLYFLRLRLPGQNPSNGPFLVVASNIQLTFKISATDALVWAVDLRSHAPLPNSPITLYGEDGRALASGQTGSDGVFRATFPARQDPFNNAYAVLSQPGEEDFSLAMSNWDQGTASWDFGIATDFNGPHLQAYLYTDRPIYRPGQTVYFRAVVRQAYNGRYNLPDQKSLPLSLTAGLGE